LWIPCCVVALCFLYQPVDPADPHCFPPRRSSDLVRQLPVSVSGGVPAIVTAAPSGASHLKVSAKSLEELRRPRRRGGHDGRDARSEEHTSELQSRFDLVCRLLLEKKNKYSNI